MRQRLTREQIQKRLEQIESELVYESFGSDHEYRYELMEERAELRRQLKQ